MWNAVVELVKSIRNLKIVLFAYAFLFGLYLQVPYVEQLIGQLPLKYKVAFQISGLFSAILSLALLVEYLFKLARGYWQARKRPDVLKNLTPDEKEILRGFVFENKRTQFFRFSSGEVNHLVAMQVIYRASNLAKIGDVFAYNIQPWALEYLLKNPQVIDGESVDIDHLQDPLSDY